MDTRRIAKAAEFAIRAHGNKMRKGTEIPYINHVLEAGYICISMLASDDVVMAAILHDTIEDTATTYEMLQAEFGTHVADLVAAESEDKMPNLPAETSWRLRKEATIRHLATASREVKMICLADKLSNMRLTVKTYAVKGDAMWQAFNQKDPREQAWYYTSVAEALAELEDLEPYQELVSLCQQVFGAKG